MATPAAGGWNASVGTPTSLFLVRHGQTEMSVARQYSGRTDAPLTERGNVQASAVAQRLSSIEDISVIVSSPLVRAVATAEAIAQHQGLETKIMPELIETDFGAWEGLTFGEAQNNFPELHQQWLGDNTIAPPDGESFSEVAQRVLAAKAQLISQFYGKKIVVISHVTPLKLLLQHALDVGPQLLYRLHLDLAGLSIIDFYPDGGASVRLVNDTSHLG